MKVKGNIRFRKKREPSKIIIVLIIVIAIFVISILSIRHYNNPNLIGKWKSEETGIIVEFTEKGTVNVGNEESARYTIESENLMTYIIEEHEFKMLYNLDGRNLIWGLEGEEERFKRNGL